MLVAPGLLPKTSQPPAAQPGVTWAQTQQQQSIDPGQGGPAANPAPANPPPPATPPPPSWLTEDSRSRIVDTTTGQEVPSYNPAAAQPVTPPQQVNSNYLPNLGIAQSYWSNPGLQAPSAPPQQQQAPTPYGRQGLNIFDLQRGVYGAMGGQYGYQGQQLSAERNVVGATGQQLAAERQALSAQNAYLQIQQAANGANTQEQRNLEAARNDTAGIEAASRTQNEEDNQNYRYAAGGMQAPVSAVLPPGVASTTPGVRAAILTPEQRYQWQTQGPDAIRGLQVASAGMTAQAAQNAATGAGLNTREASNAATAAGLNTQEASLSTDRAKLALEEAQQPDAAGMEYSPILGRSVTPQEASIARANSNRVVWDPVNGEYVARSGEDVSRNALGLLSSRGNIVRRSDGAIVDSATGNVYDPNTRQWTDPNSGNIYDPEMHAWADPQSGNVYHITNPRSGAGYWMSPQGFVLTSDGIWRDPATGQAIFNGQGYSTRRAAATPSVALPQFGP